MFNMRVTSLLLFIFFFTSDILVQAEEKKLSEAYVVSRTEVFKELRGKYQYCTNKIGNQYYAKFFEKCINDPKSKIIKERCGHEAQLAAERYIIKDKANDACSHLKPERNDYDKRLKEVMLEKKISKYEK